MSEFDTINTTSARAYFFISSSDFVDWAYINQQLDIIPTKSWSKGDIRIPKGTNRHTQDCDILFTFSRWEYMTPLEESYDSDDQINPLLDIFTPKVNHFIHLRQKYSLDFGITLVTYFYNGQTSAIGFDERLIKFLHDINGTISLDQYVYPFADED